jgi:hypothetical protein
LLFIVNAKERFIVQKNAKNKIKGMSVLLKERGSKDFITWGILVI